MGVEAAVSGLGIALARTTMAQQYIEERRLVRLARFERRIRAPFAHYMVYRATEPQLQKIAAFRNWLIEQAADSRAVIGEIQNSL